MILSSDGATSLVRRQIHAAASSQSPEDASNSGTSPSADPMIGPASEDDIEWEKFHELDAGGQCPEIPIIQYPTRLDKSTMKCLDDATAHIVNITCHSEAPTTGENRVMMAYPGMVNVSDYTKRYAKVFVPPDDASKPQGGWPIMVLFHATLSLGAGSGEVDDAKAPESHFDGLVQNSEVESFMNRMIVVVPAGFERYRFDTPPCAQGKYTSEFNYLQSSLGHTRHSNADDVRFLSMIMDWLHRSQVADLSRIHLSGHSSGADMVFSMMTQYLYGTEHDGLEFAVAGGSASAGSFLTCLNDPRVAHGANGDWSNLSPMPFMYFQGLQDVASWCAGGGMYRHQGEHMFSTEQMAISFAQRNKCSQHSDGSYRVRTWLLDADPAENLAQSATLWQFLNCEAPVIVYTFKNLDHILQPMNVFMFKQKMKLFLNEWAPPVDGGIETMLDTKNGTTLCGCCNEATGQCDYTGHCNGQNYLQTVSCPGVADIKSSCWKSNDLIDNPICWWITSETSSDG